MSGLRPCLGPRKAAAADLFCLGSGNVRPSDQATGRSSQKAKISRATARLTQRSDREPPAIAANSRTLDIGI
jgi:hypothetical protein